MGATNELCEFETTSIMWQVKLRNLLWAFALATLLTDERKIHNIYERLHIDEERNTRVVRKIRFPRSCNREERCYAGSGDTGV
jgi:hypothetical protein